MKKIFIILFCFNQQWDVIEVSYIMQTFLHYKTFF